MRYRLPFDRLINRIVPHYLSGRRTILFLQSLVYPLQTFNDRFAAFAKEKQIEARMTSQVVYFEWFLNYKFGKYLLDRSEKIAIVNGVQIGVELYHENSRYGKPFTVWCESEQVIAFDPSEEPQPMYYSAEGKAINKVSFMVSVPEIGISEHEFVYMMSHVVNKYKTAGKTYLIRINGKEIKPNGGT